MAQCVDDFRIFDETICAMAEEKDVRWIQCLEQEASGSNQSKLF